MLFENVLSQSDKELIDAWISDYAIDEVNTTRSRAPLSHLLRYWDSNKESLFKMFGENLILSKQVMIAKENGDMEREIGYSMCEREGGMGLFYHNLSNFVDRHYCELGVNRWSIFDLMSHYCLATNEYRGDSFVVNVPNGGKAIQVQRGCKPVKILGKIAAAWNIEGFEEFRLAHSRILNQKMMKGELCLSIHPMDFMTMSDNDCDWDSCMSWRNGGCYRRGTVEMMNSDCVVVAYLRASEDMRFYDKYWNNKKWRQLFIVKPECIVGVKGYPYCHDGLADECINWMCDLAQQNLGWEYKKAVYTMEHEDWFKVDGDESWKLTFYCDTMYNDFGTCGHRVRVSATPKTGYEHKYEFNYSGPEVCMYCGDSCADYDGEEPLVCNSCAEFCYCCCCDDRINPDSAIEVDGSYYCEYCYNEHVMECPVSGQEHHESAMQTVYLVPDDYPEEEIRSDSCYCCCMNLDDICDPHTVSEEQYKQFFKMEDRKFGRFGAYWREYWYVRVSQCTEDGLALFDINDASDMEWFLKHHKR